MNFIGGETLKFAGKHTLARRIMRPYGPGRGGGDKSPPSAGMTAGGGAHRRSEAVNILP